jgi:Family of unknown function (DUF5681)
VSAERAPSLKKVGRNKEFYENQWKPGQSGNPTGRPPGARQHIENDFLTDALQDWRKSGKASFRALAKKNPHDYLRLIAEVGHVIGKQHSPGEHEPVDDHRPVLAVGDLLAFIANGTPPPNLPDRSVRTFDSSPQPAGCDAPVDSRPLPGDPE